MRSPSNASPTALSDSRIITDGGSAEDDGAHRTLNRLAASPTDHPASTSAPASDNTESEASSPPVPGRKRRLSFKEKQRLGVSHVAGSPTKASLTADSSSGVFQSPTSTGSSTSPQQSDISPSASQSLQPARKKTTTDFSSSSTSGGGGAYSGGCVFTALEPTRGGPRGAARPPHRGPTAHASPALSSTTLSVSPATSAAPSPLNRPTSPPEQIAASVSLMQSPLTLRDNTGDTTAPATVSSASPFTTSPSPLSTVNDGARLREAAGGQPQLGELSQPGASLTTILSAVSAGSPKASSTSSAASPKLSFKDRQRAAAAAAAAGTGGNASRSLSLRGSVSSPVTQVPSTAEASSSFTTKSPHCSLSPAEPSVNQERALSRPATLPATAAVTSPTRVSPLYVDPVMTHFARLGGSSSSTFSGEAVTAKGNASATQTIPRLPIDRISQQSSQQQQPKQQQPPPAVPQHTGEVKHADAPTVPPLTLPPTPADAGVSNVSAASSSSVARSAQSAPATAAERRVLHTNPLVTGASANTESSSHPTTTTTTTNTTPSKMSSRADEDDEDAENAGLAFTLNATHLHMDDPDEPSPQFAHMSALHQQATGSSGGTAARSATMAERSAPNCGEWGRNSRQQSVETEGGSDDGPKHTSNATMAATMATTHSVRGSGVGSGGEGGDRRAFATRRARTDSLGSPSPYTATVPPSPSPWIPFAASPGSHAPHKMATAEHAKLPEKAKRPSNIVVGHWKQHGGSQHGGSQHQQQTAHACASALQELPPLLVDASEHSISVSDAQASRASRSHARRHRDKMLAPDGAVLSTPRTGRGPGGESGGSAFAGVSSSRMHGRSYTVDDFVLYAANAGHKGGARTPSTVTPGSAMYTANATPITVVPPVPGYGAASGGGGGGRAHVGPLDSSERSAGSRLPLSPSTNDTVLTADVNQGGRAQPMGSPRTRGLVSFPSLPPLHERTNSAGSAMSRVSLAMAAVLLPSAPSAENMSAATPVTVATPNGYRSADERSSNEVSRGNQTEPFSYAPPEQRGETTVLEDVGNAEAEYLLQTYNTYYAGETSLSATTAELRKARRRSNYSSLHYGTMTGYHRRGDSRRPRSSSAALKGRRQPRSSGRRELTDSNNEEAYLGAQQRGTPPLDERSMTVVREGMHSTDNDDEESICEQKGSAEDRDREATDLTRAHRLTSLDQPRNRQQQQQLQSQLHAAGVSAALMDEEDDTEDAQRRTIGLWETIENIFLPRYELVPEAASKEPLTGPASPSSPHPSGSGSTVKADAKAENASPLLANLKSGGSSPQALPSHGLQIPPMVRLSSPPGQMKSPYTTASATPPGGHAGSSAQNSPSLGPRPSGLVVLPDAANLGEDPGFATSLTYSQFRRTPAQVAGTKRLEPEKFSFGTVAADYNMEPVDEQALPDGARDAKVAARLIFDAATGVMLMDPEDEGGRYEQQGRTSPDARSRSSSPRANEEEDGDGGAGDGACQCPASFITKDFKGMDCSRYDASELYDHCSRCHRRPAAFLCLHCLEAVCPSHVQRHHLLNPTQCTLFLNLLDIMSSFDRIFWCERCKQFTWKHTEIYDSLVDQIAYTRGTYLKHPARDIHCVGYEVRLKDATATAGAAASAAATAALARARSEHSTSDDATSSNRGSPARLRHAMSGSSLNAPVHGLAPHPTLATFPLVSGASLAASSPQMRSGTPPVQVPPNKTFASVQPSMLGVNNLIVFGASPSSPMGGNGQASRLHHNAIGTPSLQPLASPMQSMLSRDPLETSGARAVTVGEPVTKLCALGASVQGWRTTQEDAEAVFLIDIPALANEVVDRRELRAVAAAAAADKKKKAELQERQRGNTPARDLQSTLTGSLDETGAKNANEEARSRSHSEGARDGSVLVHEASLAGSPESPNPPAFDATLPSSDRPATAMAEMKHTDEEESTQARHRSGASPLAESDNGTSDAAPGKAAKETIPMAVFCVFDGHGGDAVAKLAARHFETHLRRAIEGTRADDVRARALLFYLNAESNAAALAGLQPTMTAIPGADGSFTFIPANATAVFAAAAAAMQRGSGMINAGSPPLLYPSPPNAAASPHSGGTAPSSSGHSKLLVPGNSQPCALDSGEASPAPPSSTPAEEEDNDMPHILQLPEAMYAESIPVVMPVTAESLRLHMAGSTVNFPGSGEDNAHKPPPPRSNTGLEGSGLNRNRRSKTTLDAWADMEDSPAEMAASSAAAAAAAAAAASSPMAAKLLPASFAGAASPHCGGSGGGDPRHYGATGPQAAMAASTSFNPSPSAWVSIPEMEMLRQYFASIMEEALLSLDSYLRNTPEGLRGDYDCVGCTACVVGITANFVLCANVGDSGAAFYTKDRIKVISVKHRVSDEAEQKRINAAGYSIVNDRIEGMSAVPRALGDFDFKQCGGRGPHEQAVSAVPDVTIMPTPSDTDQWGIILACDGVWDTATLHQVHVALTNTVNDLDVASSATEAVLRGAELYQHHLRGPGAPREDSSPSSSPHRSSTSMEGSGGAATQTRSRQGSTSASPAKRRALLQEENGEGSVIGEYEVEDGVRSRRLYQVDPILLTAAAGVFAQCVAPADNDEGVGLDNCSLILVERRNVQE